MVKVALKMTRSLLKGSNVKQQLPQIHDHSQNTALIFKKIIK